MRSASLSLRSVASVFPGIYQPLTAVRRPRRWSLRRRLIALVGVSLLPLLSAAYWLVDDSAYQAKAAILRDSLATARATEADIGASLITTQRLLSRLVERSPVRNGDIEGTKRLFQDALSSHPELLNIAAADRSGRISAAATWVTEEPPRIADRDYFRQVMLTGWPTISPTRLTSRSTGLPTVVVAVPIKDQTGLQTGVAIGELSLQRLQTKLAAASSLSNGDVVLVDSGGTLISHQNWRLVVEGARFPYSPAVAAALSGQRGTLEVDDRQSGHRVLVAYVPVTGTSWVLAVIHPAERAYAALWDSMWHNIAVLLLGVASTVVLAFLLLRWTSRPFDTLSASVRRVIENNPETRSSPATGDELQLITDAFDSLAKTLDARATQLAELRRQIDSSNDKVKRLSEEMTSAAEEQRKRIARDIHDGVAQLLATAFMEVQEAEHCMALDLGASQQKVHAALQVLRQISSEMRCSLYELHPPGLESGRLVAGLREYVARYSIVSGLRCTIEVRGALVVLDQDLEAVIYCVFREALQNVRKHARAAKAHCCLCFEADSVRLVISDDGQGFSNCAGFTSLPGHLGLVSMDERAREVDGNLTIESAPGRGTVVILQIPLLPAAAQSSSASVTSAGVGHRFGLTV